MSRSTTLPLLAIVVLIAGCSNKLHGADTDGPRRPPEDTDTNEPIDTDLPPDTDVPDQPVDNDHDGYDTTTDCDDADPFIYPGAPERCNGLDDNCDGVVPPDETDRDDNGVRECNETCDRPDPSSPTATRNECEFQPSPSGTPFRARVEWAMTQAMTDPTGASIPAYHFADFPTFTSVFQAPVVGQATDDNGDGRIDASDDPDIAVVMTDDADSDKTGVLRLIRGDGAAVIASTQWQTITNQHGTARYTPYHYAGQAIGDVDGDPAIEIATLVTRESDGACFPGVYEVHQSGNTVSLLLERVYGGAAYSCSAHAPALADLEGNGTIELIYGRAVFEGQDFSQLWYGSGGRGWYGTGDYAGGYWNSGYHAFAYDVDGDGRTLEVVAGKTVYTSTGGTFCELGRYNSTGAWVPAVDGYPAIADIARFSGDRVGEPEIVVTGNEAVSVYHGSTRYDPNGLKRCLLISSVANDPLDDPTVPAGLPAPASCDATAVSFGGPPTVADFDGDGKPEIGVAGSCWYSVFDLDDPARGLVRYAMANTRDWSSASTGSTVFDFNGDGADEVVFSDEQALYVWGVNTAANLKPWQRLEELLRDDSHKSWTIHEYPLVADVDADGKAEIVVVNSHLPPDHEDVYGIYVLGAADDDWVSARKVWTQHAYYVTNADDDGDLGTCEPNYAPYTVPALNTFRTQAPGEFGALQASNAFPVVEPLCQVGCGTIGVRVHVGNDSPHVTLDSTLIVALYGETGNHRTLIEAKPMGVDVPPGVVGPAVEFSVPGSVWSDYDRLVAIVDDPTVTGLPQGAARECDETDNEADIALDGICP